MTNMIFSKRLKKEREKRGWSQTDLAEEIHVSRQSVSKWETGKNYPSIASVIATFLCYLHRDRFTFP